MFVLNTLSHLNKYIKNKCVCSVFVSSITVNGVAGHTNAYSGICLDTRVS